MAKEIKASAVQGGIRHDNHTATVGLTLRPLPKLTNYLLIKNRDGANPAHISFDGVNFYTLDPRESLSIEASGIISYYTGGGVVLEVLIGGEI